MPYKRKTINFIDLFAGLGGTRIGFEQACQELGIASKCVFTSEIKAHAVETYQNNFPNEKITGDITKVEAKEIPNFDILLGGFPCQAFSFSGKRRGFADTRGTLFFDIARILKEKQPIGFVLENVEGLVVHDRERPTDKIGRTLTTIITTLEDLGYKVSWKLLDSSDFGVAQRRKRVYIVGSKNNLINLDNLTTTKSKVADILESRKSLLDTDFTKKLLSHFSPKELHGKSIKDKRGGPENIHSWDIGLKGETTPEQRKLLEELLKERRKKKWAKDKGIKWMDGMPLTLEEIHTFYKPSSQQSSKAKLKILLDDLVKKGYLAYEEPKILHSHTDENGYSTHSRVRDTNGIKGYNIVSGKLSFEFSQILDPKGVSPTLVATDMSKIGIIDGSGIRRLTIREGLRLFGFPEKYRMKLPEKQAYDLLGNSIVVPVIKLVSKQLIQNLVG